MKTRNDPPCVHAPLLRHPLTHFAPVSRFHANNANPVPSAPALLTILLPTFIVDLRAWILLTRCRFLLHFRVKKRNRFLNMAVYEDYGDALRWIDKVKLITGWWSLIFYNIFFIINRKITVQFFFFSKRIVYRSFFIDEKIFWNENHRWMIRINIKISKKIRVHNNIFVIIIA